MKVSKERKVLLILFGLGLVGLVVDRVFFAPASAAAAPATGEAAPSATDTKTESSPAPAAPVGASGPSFAKRLQEGRLWTPGSGRDAFEAPREWVGARIQQEAPAAEAECEFAKRHKLSAVMSRVDKKTGKNVLTAIIEGGTYEVNNTLDGYRLKELRVDADGTQWAIFERKDELATLKVIPEKTPVRKAPTDKQCPGEPGCDLMGPPAPQQDQIPKPASAGH